MLSEFPFLRVLRQKLLDICRRALLYNIDFLYWGCTELMISYCLCICVCLFLICVIVVDDVDDGNGWFCILAVDDVDDDSGWLAETKIKISKTVKNCKTSLFALMIAKFALLIPKILKLANVT